MITPPKIWRWASIALSCAVLLVTAGAVPAAEADGAVERGIAAYWAADFATAERELRAAETQALSPADSLRLHQYLALCAIANQDPQRAEREFLELLALEPRHRLDPAQFAPSVRERFDLARLSMLEGLFDEAREDYFAGRYAEAAQRYERALAIDPWNDFARVFLEWSRHRAALARDESSAANVETRR